MIVGVISDTHGLLRPEAVEALRGSELVLHAGDIGAPWIVDHLMTIAPVQAVRGNTDTEHWARRLPEQVVVQAGGARILLVHDVLTAVMEPGLTAVVAGHSHRPSQRVQAGVLFFNPGSAGPRRFSLPVAVGKLKVGGDGVSGELLTLLPQK